MKDKKGQDLLGAAIVTSLLKLLQLPRLSYKSYGRGSELDRKISRAFTHLHRLPQLQIRLLSVHVLKSQDAMETPHKGSQESTYPMQLSQAAIHQSATCNRPFVEAQRLANRPENG